MKSKTISRFFLCITIVTVFFLFGGNQPVLSQFNKERAFKYLKQQCNFGPRYPGSENHKKMRDFLVAELRQYTNRVKTQPFMAVNYLENKRAQGFNVIASFGEGKTELILCAHWDSRPKADHDPSAANRDKPMPAANDGASGVAVLLEIARYLKTTPPPIPVDIVLFDAEDMGREAHENEFLQGSRFFAENISYSYKPSAAILLDMVGDRELQFYVEENSKKFAPDVVDRIWSIAERLGFPEFVRKTRYAMTDDHIPLIKTGIPAVDIIDFDYPYWHTIEDTPDKCSPESLEKVGRVLLQYIYGEK